MNKFTQLHTLVLIGNSLGDIPQSIGDIRSINVLSLFNTDVNSVPSSLGNLTNMVLLVLQNNPITSIPQSVCDLQISNGGILTILTDPGEECE